MTGFLPKKHRCRKVMYCSELAAQLGLASAFNDPDPKRKETRYYWCKYCLAYHLTSSDKGEQD